MKEKWIQINKIQGYENIKDCYYLSNSDEDKIMNRSTNKRVKGWINKDGYKIIGLRTKDGKIKYCGIHVLKAKAFIFGPNALGANIVRHLNDVKNDNRLENLAFGTQSDNNLDCIRNGKFNYEAAARGGAKTGAKLSKAVRCIETGEIFPSAYEAERQLGIHRGSISRCCCGKHKTSGGLHFEFVDSDE